MSTEKIISNSEFFLTQAARTNHEADDYLGRALSWESSNIGVSREYMALSKERVGVARILQDCAWDYLKTSFRNEGLDVVSEGKTLSDQQLEALIRSEMMDYYSKSRES